MTPGGNKDRAGDRNPNARLSLEAVREARRRHQQGHSIARLARELGVHHSTMADVIKRASWRDA